VASTLATIIERDRAEQEKKDLQLQLAHAEKLAALGRFTANIAHEIRNPLTSVGGFARRLDKVMPEDTKEKEYTKIIIAEVSRLEKILNNILSFSKEAPPNYTKNNIADVIERMLVIHADLLKEKSIDVQKNIANIPKFSFDKDLLIEALDNILLNAVDSMTEGGTLTVITEKEEKQEGARVSVKVKDTGAGISQDQLEMIFEPFYTTKVAEGTGLGLSITRKIMESMDGTVDIESEVGKGSTITLSLPFNGGQKQG
ncbi:MAG TPA: sensor histidine kinase, partial [Flavobacteriales bacterium]|nr:sensor histidine kinase [Flavobacteriales bacterium]